MIPLPTNPVTATTLLLPMALSGFTVNPVVTALTLLPLLALAVHGTSHRGRIVARSSAPTHARRDESAQVPSRD